MSTFSWRVLMERFSFDAFYYALALNCCIWCSRSTTLLLNLSYSTILALFFLLFFLSGTDALSRQTDGFSHHFLSSTQLYSASVFWQSVEKISDMADFWEAFFCWHIVLFTGWWPSSWSFQSLIRQQQIHNQVIHPVTPYLRELKMMGKWPYAND